MGNFTTTDGSHLVRQQGDDGDGFSRECDELDLVALAVPILHDDRAEITGLQALIRKILARECLQAMAWTVPGNGPVSNKCFDVSTWEGAAGMLQNWSWLPSDPDCFRCGFVSFGEGLQTPPFGRPEVSR